MNFYAISALINITLLITSQIILLINIRRSKAILVFNFFNLAVLFWAVSYFFWQTTTNYQTALFWVKMLMIGAIFAAPTFLHFSAVIINKAKKMTPLIIIAYLSSAIFAYLDFNSPLYIIELKNKLNIPLFPTAGIHYTWYLVQWTIWFLIGFYLLLREAKKTSGEEKEFINALAWGTLISISAGSFNYFLWYDVPVPPITTLVTAAYGIVVSFMLLRSRFYKINLFYFEFFAAFAILISLLQFFLTNQHSNLMNFTALGIIIFCAYFLIKIRIHEREHLEKIFKFNLTLNETITQIINSVDDAALILNKRMNIIAVNKGAKEMFGQNDYNYPESLADFCRTKINQSLPLIVQDFFENNKKYINTEILFPKHYNVKISLSPFSKDEVGDAVVVIIQKINL